MQLGTMIYPGPGRELVDELMAAVSRLGRLSQDIGVSMARKIPIVRKVGIFTGKIAFHPLPHDGKSLDDGMFCST